MFLILSLASGGISSSSSLCRKGKQRNQHTTLSLFPSLPSYMNWGIPHHHTTHVSHSIDETMSFGTHTCASHAKYASLPPSPSCYRLALLLWPTSLCALLKVWCWYSTSDQGRNCQAVLGKHTLACLKLVEAVEGEIISFNNSYSIQCSIPEWESSHSYKLEAIFGGIS